MDFITAVKSVYGRYFDFQGRSRRSEYWWFVLFYIIAAVVLSVGIGSINETLGGLAYVVFILGTFIPNLAVSIRRLHDSGKSGFWILISFVPIVGFIVLLIFMIKDSEPGDNKYGPNPKGETAAEPVAEA